MSEHSDNATRVSLMASVPVEVVQYLIELTGGMYDSDDEVVADILRLVAPVVATELNARAAGLEAAFINGPIDRESAAYGLRQRAEKWLAAGGAR